MRFKSFLKRFQVEYLTTALVGTFARFPLSVTTCAGAAVLSILATHDVKLLSDDDMLRALLFMAYALVFFTVARLYSEGRQLPRAREATIMFAGGIALLALAVIPDRFTAMHIFIGAALGVSMLFAPYLGRKSTEDSVWYFNYLNGVSLAIAGVSTFILCLGLSAIVASMDYLLYDMKLSKDIYGDIWVFGGTFFGPVMFMHQIPRQFDFEKNECAIPAGIYFIANYLVVPLVLIYMWVLYVYFLKIAVQWELPKGNLAYMVTGFGSLGTAARLAVFPMRDYGTKLLQQFYKYFYYILIVPVLLLAIGLYTRVSQYGVTEDRYAIGVCLAWLTALTVWNLARPGRAHIKHVPMVLCLLFLLASGGPWGAVHVSTYSQLARLGDLLGKAGVLHQDGAVSKTAQDVPFELRKDISGILDYMYAGREEVIVRYVDPFRAEIEKAYKEKGEVFEARCKRSFTGCGLYYQMPQAVMNAWGMHYVPSWEVREGANATGDDFRISYYDGTSDATKVAPFTHIATLWPNVATPAGCAVRLPDAKAPKGTAINAMLASDGMLSIMLPDGRKDVFNLVPLAREFHKEKVENVTEAERGKLVLKPVEEGFPAEAHVTAMNGHVGNNNTFDFDSANIVLLFTP